ncbi:YggT family protein [Candidatus Woesebacteria bacterium]|nr:YggT family protein [Candidatus Woesebacteria bacterium]
MSEVTRETITTKELNNRPVAQSSIKSTTKTNVSKSQQIEQILYFAFGALEVLLTFRFILKLTGASQISSFVQFIYNLSRIFILPFEGIFRRAVAEGIETNSIIEPSTLVALIVYPIFVWGIVSLVRMFSGESQTE